MALSPNPEDGRGRVYPEQRTPELRQSPSMRTFSISPMVLYMSSLPYDFLNNTLFSQVYFTVRNIVYNVTYKMC